MQWHKVNNSISKEKTRMIRPKQDWNPAGKTPKSAAPCLACRANGAITWAPKGLNSCPQHTQPLSCASSTPSLPLSSVDFSWF